MDPHTYGQLIVYSDKKATQWRRILFKKCWWKKSDNHMQKIKIKNKETENMERIQPILTTINKSQVYHGPQI